MVKHRRDVRPAADDRDDTYCFSQSYACSCDDLKVIVMPSIAISNHKSFPFFYCSFLFVGFRSRIYDVRLRLRLRLLHLRLLHLRLLRLNYCPLHHQLMMMINGYLQYVHQKFITTAIIVTVIYAWMSCSPFYLGEIKIISNKKENNETNAYIRSITDYSIYISGSQFALLFFVLRLQHRSQLFNIYFNGHNPLCMIWQIGI